MRASRIADFLVQEKLNLPCRNWKREDLESWIDWAIMHGHCGIAMHKGKLQGVGIGRPIGRIEDGGRYYAVDYQGPILWIDLVASVHPQGMKTVWQMALDRFGQRESVAFARFKDNVPKVHVYAWEKLKSKLSK